MKTMGNVDLTHKGELCLSLSETGQETTLTLSLDIEGETGNDFTGDSFLAWAGEEDADKVSLTVSAGYDAGLDSTYVVVTFPATGIPERGRYVVTWLRVGDVTPKKILIGDYIRDNTVLAWPPG